MCYPREESDDHAEGYTTGEKNSGCMGRFGLGCGYLHYRLVDVLAYCHCSIVVSPGLLGSRNLLFLYGIVERGVWILVAVRWACLTTVFGLH